MEVEDLGHHISKRFNEDLEHVRNSVLAMGGLVEEQLDRAIKALSEANSELGLQVAEDDIKVNRMEVSIDEECSRILATRAPTLARYSTREQLLLGLGLASAAAGPLVPTWAGLLVFGRDAPRLLADREVVCIEFAGLGEPTPAGRRGWLDQRRLRGPLVTQIEGASKPYKVVYVVNFRDGMSREDADEHWTNTHGPLFHTVPIRGEWPL